MSLANRRRMMLFRATSKNEPENMISVLPVDTEQIPFPYTKYKYAMKVQGSIGSSDYPMYILKSSDQYYSVLAAQPRTPIGGKNFLDIDADTSELGDVVYQIWQGTRGASSFGVCNYPVQEVRYTDDKTKLYIVRE